jgi:hypothetical protein
VYPFYFIKDKPEKEKEIPQPFKKPTPSGSIFGSTLVEILAKENSTIPKLVTQCIAHVDLRGIISFKFRYSLV